MKIKTLLAAFIVVLAAGILNGEDITFLWLTSPEDVGEWRDCKVKGNVMTVVIDDEEWKLIKQ